jgi:pyridoxamine 5'-phosphate oxidase
MDLGHYRRAYEGAGLDRADLHPDPVEQFEYWFSEVASTGMFEPNAMVVATVDAVGRPAARNVLLKSFDHGGFVFYTNTMSAKGRALDATGWGALLFSWIELRRQVHVSGPVARVADHEADDYFAGRPRGSQIGAWASPQSEVLADRAELDARFAAETERWDGRAVSRPSHWSGYRVRPEVVEFWQGRPDRLHDRFRYRLVDGAWCIERLAP